MSQITAIGPLRIALGHFDGVAAARRRAVFVVAEQDDAGAKTPIILRAKDGALTADSRTAVHGSSSVDRQRPVFLGKGSGAAAKVDVHLTL